MQFLILVVLLKRQITMRKSLKGLLNKVFLSCFKCDRSKQRRFYSTNEFQRNSG